MGGWSYLVNYSRRIQVLRFRNLMLVLFVLFSVFQNPIKLMRWEVIIMLLVQTSGHKGSGSLNEGPCVLPGPGQSKFQRCGVLKNFKLVIILTRRFRFPGWVLFRRSGHFLQIFIPQNDLVFAVGQVGSEITRLIKNSHKTKTRTK